MIDTTPRPEARPTPHDARSRRTRASVASRRRAASASSDAVIAAYVYELHHEATRSRAETYRPAAAGSEER